LKASTVKPATGLSNGAKPQCQPIGRAPSAAYFAGTLQRIIGNILINLIESSDAKPKLNRRAMAMTPTMSKWSEGCSLTQHNSGHA
jgi:hypothetical protein